MNEEHDDYMEQQEKRRKKMKFIQSKSNLLELYRKAMKVHNDDVLDKKKVIIENYYRKQEDRFIEA